MYKLHYKQFVPTTDFFTYRVVLPAVTTELLRFDITFLPGETSLHLVNRTLVVIEGQRQQVSKNTLWFQTADEADFSFVIALVPAFGRLVLDMADEGESRELGLNDTFVSADLRESR